MKLQVVLFQAKHKPTKPNHNRKSVITVARASEFLRLEFYLSC
jgi:hypothetical protein